MSCKETYYEMIGSMQKKSPIFKTPEDSRHILLLFLYFTGISLTIILSGYSLLGTNDDLVLRNFLTGGEFGTLIMSYPLSALISTLYSHMPQIPWYSLILFIYMSVIGLLFAIYITKLKDRHLKIISILLGTIILIHAWMSMTITLPTLLLLALSVPLIRNHQVGFWGLVFLASLLRGEIIINLFPLFAITYFLLFNKESLTPKKILTIFLLIIAILLNYLSASLDSEYKEWLHFNKARTYLQDYNDIGKKDIFSEDEKFIVFSSWWAQDTVLLPTEKVIQATGSKIDVITNIFSKLTIKNIARIFYLHKLLVLLILITIYILYKEQKYIPRVLYALFPIALFTLLLIRDRDWVTFPLVILWSILVFIKLLKDKEITLLKGFLFISIFILIVELPRNRVLKNQDNERLKDEFIHLANKYPMKYEIALDFPRSFRNIATVLNQNRIFNESQWIQDGPILLFTAWSVRHPYFYKSHDISFKGEKRKYKTFYGFLMDENTGFIGSKISDPIKNSTILKMYDNKYPLERDCHHVIKTLDESEHFSITQIIKKCEK